jgi:hypothetical protein
MGYMPDLSIPLQGMLAAGAGLDATAARIARLPVAFQMASSGADVSPSDQIDLSTEAVNLLQEKASFTANTKAARVMDETNRALLDMMG